MKLYYVDYPSHLVLNVASFVVQEKEEGGITPLFYASD
jgi:hypothetical protein